MTKMSPEEKRKEASDWTKGLIGLAIVLGIILIGYVVFQGVKNNLLQQQAQKSKHERITQNPDSKNYIISYISDTNLNGISSTL